MGNKKPFPAMAFELYHGDYYVYLRYEEDKTLVLSPDGTISTLDLDENGVDFNHTSITDLHDFLWQLIDNNELEKVGEQTE